MGLLSRLRGGGFLTRLERIEERLGRIESALESIAREEALREEVDRLRDELDGLSQQSLHVVELLGQSRRRVEELEGGDRS